MIVSFFRCWPLSRSVGGQWKMLQLHKHRREPEMSLPSSLCLEAATWTSAPISSDAQTQRAWRKTAISTWKRARSEDKKTWICSSATALLITVIYDHIKLSQLRKIWTFIQKYKIFFAHDAEVWIWLINAAITAFIKCTQTKSHCCE